MNKYKDIWERLKSHIDDEDILELMEEYELEIKPKKIKKQGMKYPIKLSEQPWYHTYDLIRQIVFNRERRGTINHDFLNNFNNEFFEWTKKVASGEKTTEELGKWITMKHKEFQSRESGKAQGRKEITKPRYTESGFERKYRDELSLDERAAIIIDELIAIFTPTVSKEFNLKIDYYEEDWKQELWAWCWENKDKDTNLKALIVDYNRLPSTSYKFHVSNFLSRMNSYIVPYISKLQYSCNDVGRYRMSDKFIEEELYPADNVHVKYEDGSVNPETLVISDKREIVKFLFKKLEEYVPITKESYRRYQKVLEMRYGLNPENREYTYIEIGKYFDLSKQRIYQMETWILQQLREIIVRKKIEI